MTDEQVRALPDDEINAELARLFGRVAECKQRMMNFTQQAIDEDWDADRLRDARAADKKQVDDLAVEVGRLQDELERRRRPRA